MTISDWLIIIAAVSIVTPIVVYFSSKFGTFAKLRAEELFRNSRSINGEK